MVGLTVGLIIVMAAGAMYITNLLSARDTGASLRLNSEVRMAMDVMIDEIRRAGYSPGSTPATNPFMVAGIDGTDLRVNAAGTCVEFACTTICVDSTCNSAHKTSIRPNQWPRRHSHNCPRLHYTHF